VDCKHASSKIHTDGLVCVLSVFAALFEQKKKSMEIYVSFFVRQRTVAVKFTYGLRDLKYYTLLYSPPFLFHCVGS
jgi:hypothetical protein